MNLKFSMLFVLFVCAACSESGSTACSDELQGCAATASGESSGVETSNGQPTDAGLTATGAMSSGGEMGSGTYENGSATSTGSETTEDLVTTSLGEPEPACGNGILEAFGPQREDCDDGNDIGDDGCSACGRDRLVFVTSVDYQGGIFDGLGGADQRCRSLADQAGLPNFAGFRAWLSDSQTSAVERLFRGRGRYVLVNGLVVADSWDALLAGEIQNPINATEISGAKDYRVWTGTNPDGSVVADADHCADWTENLLANTGFTGSTKAVSAEWSLLAPMVDQPASCSLELGLYCFEQE